MNDDKDKQATGEEDERTVFAPGGSGDSAGKEPGERTSSLSDPEPPPIVPESEQAPPAEEPRTVFAPAPSEPSGAEPPAAPKPSAPDASSPEEPRTVFAPSTPEPTAPEPAPPPVEAPAQLAASAASGAATAAIVPRQAARGIQVGDVLNHIFEVKRFIGRGGMGEVFEGCNVNTDERVAIKVMLPAMAADEKIVGLFRKEAKTLTKLQHEGLVSYRVLAQEPQLGVLYIVTEFIEGVELSDLLDKVANSPDEQIGLLRRLASGLAHAHRLGAVHRDLSPDNVLLPGGDVHEATIIDFGIAKDLNAGSATIVGDGFAGKLNYVAPEQLGDYGREIGPWTDVYSLGLVMLAVAQGKPVDMSGSLVDAIDKRRKGPDLAAVPRNLRSVLEDMLRPDPKERLRSMDEVLARLGGAGPKATAAPPPPPPPPPAAPEGGGGAIVTAGPSGPSMKPWLIAGLVVAALIAAAAAFYLLGGLDWGKDDGNDILPDNKVERVGDPVVDARNAVNGVLPSVDCTWLDIGSVEGGGGGVRVAMRGVAGDSQNAQRDIMRALEGAGIANPRLDFGDVAPIEPAGCAALDTYRQIRATATHISVPRPRFEMMMQPPGMPYADQDAANAVINLNFSDPPADFAILGIEPSGEIANLVADRATFVRNLARPNGPFVDEGNGRYRIDVDVNHRGWSGIILITGQGPFDADLVAPQVGSRGPSWQESFLAAARRGRWRVEMVWFESVDRVPGDRAQPRGLAEPSAQAEGPEPEPAIDGSGDKPTE